MMRKKMKHKPIQSYSNMKRKERNDILLFLFFHLGFGWVMICVSEVFSGRLKKEGKGNRITMENIN